MCGPHVRNRTSVTTYWVSLLSFGRLLVLTPLPPPSVPRNNPEVRQCPRTLIGHPRPSILKGLSSDVSSVVKSIQVDPLEPVYLDRIKKHNLVTLFRPFHWSDTFARQYKSHDNRQCQNPLPLPWPSEAPPFRVCLSPPSS